MVNILTFLSVLFFFQPLNPCLKSICIRNSIVAWSNEPSQKTLRVVITDLFFSKHTNTGNPQCSPVQTKMATKKGSKTNHKETKSNTTAQVLPLPNCLVCSVAPCALLICFILYFPANCLKTFCAKYDVFKGCYSLGFGSKY